VNGNGEKIWIDPPPPLVRTIGSGTIGVANAWVTPRPHITNDKPVASNARFMEHPRRTNALPRARLMDFAGERVQSIQHDVKRRKEV
jgi:hypothetical protein